MAGGRPVPGSARIPRGAIGFLSRRLAGCGEDVGELFRPAVFHAQGERIGQVFLEERRRAAFGSEPLEAVGFGGGKEGAKPLDLVEKAAAKEGGGFEEVEKEPIDGRNENRKSGKHHRVLGEHPQGEDFSGKEGERKEGHINCRKIIMTSLC